MPFLTFISFLLVAPVACGGGGGGGGVDAAPADAGGDTKADLQWDLRTEQQSGDSSPGDSTPEAAPDKGGEGGSDVSAEMADGHGEDLECGPPPADGAMESIDALGCFGLDGPCDKGPCCSPYVCVTGATGKICAESTPPPDGSAG